MSKLSLGVAKVAPAQPPRHLPALSRDAIASPGPEAIERQVAAVVRSITDWDALLEWLAQETPELPAGQFATIVTGPERLLTLLAIEGPLTQDEIARRLRLPLRDVQATLQELRRSEGVCSGSQGVWLPRTPDELAASNQRLRHRLVEQYATLRAQQLIERRMRARPSEQMALRWSA